MSKQSVEDRLRSARVGCGGAPARVSEGVGRVVAGESPGSARVTPVRVPVGIAGVAMVCLVGAVVGVVALRSGAPVEDAPGERVAAADRPADPAQPAPGVVGVSGQMVVTSVSNPLTEEARRMLADMRRMRETVEGPVRVLRDVGKSL